MVNAIQGLGLRVLNRVAASEWIDRAGARKPLEELVLRTSKAGFRIASQLGKKLANKRSRDGAGRPSGDLFDVLPSDDQVMIRETMQRFASTVLRPLGPAADTAGTPGDAVKESAAQLGLVPYVIPEVHGGAATGRSTLTQGLIAEDLAHGDMGLAVALLSSVSAASAIERWGTAEQKKLYFPRFLAEPALSACVAVSEPTVLFDPMRLDTTAHRRVGGWLLRGSKALVPLAATAELFLVAAEAHGRPAVFLVERSARGVSVGGEPAMGLKGAGLGELILDDAAGERLGDGTFDYEQFVDLGNLAYCALATGTCQAVLDYVIPYCNDRVAFGEPISHRQGVAFMIADMAIELEGMRLLTWRAACRADRKRGFHREAYLARTFVTEKAMTIGTDGVQLLGGAGYTKDHPIERWYRDLRVASVAHGLHL